MSKKVILFKISLFLIIYFLVTSINLNTFAQKSNIQKKIIKNINIKKEDYKDTFSNFIEEFIKKQEFCCNIYELIFNAVTYLLKNNANANITFNSYYFAFDENTSSEIHFLFNKSYSKPINLKEYISKYNTKDYLTLESDFLGLRGYQIVSKKSANPNIDMICYKVETDSVFIAYTLLKNNEIINNIRPLKLVDEGLFLRSAIISAIDFELKKDFTFFNISLLKKIKSKNNFVKSALKLNNQDILTIYAYPNIKTSVLEFKNFTLTDDTPIELAHNFKVDNKYKYFLNTNYIIVTPK